MSEADRPRAPEESHFVKSCARGFDLNATHPKPEVCQLWIERHAKLIPRLEPGREEPLVAYAVQEWINTTGRNPWSGLPVKAVEFSDW